MTLTKTLLSVLLLSSPLAAEANDTVGSMNKDGYYVAHLPYSETFDNYNGNYDGTSQLPNGWLASGDQPFTTAFSSQREAHTGKYYMVTIETTEARSDRAYTPYFEVEEGKTYTINYWLWMPGNSFSPSQNTLTITAGAEQDAEFHNTTLQTLHANTGNDWVNQECTFTAQESGLVCFCFNLTTDSPLAGYVGIDDLSITADDQEVPPTADFAVESLSSFMTGCYVAYPTQKVRLVNLSRNASEYKWEMPGCEPSESTEAEPIISFNHTDNYTITLHATNKSGEATSLQTFALEYIDYPTMMAIQTFEEDSKTIDRGFIPTYATDRENDFYSGVNHYYRQIAQRVAMPDIQEADITQLNYQLTNYSLIPSTSQTTWFRQTDVPMSIAIYGETEGHPDTEKCFGRYDSTIGKIVGMNGIGLSTFKQFEFPKPIHTKGTFYIAFEIGEEFIVDTPDPQIGRSLFAVEPIVHRPRHTSMWVRPSVNALTSYYNPIAKDEWMLASDFNPEMQGYGIFLYIWGQTTCPDLSNVAQPFFYDSSIEDATPALYDLSGRQISTPSLGTPYIRKGKKHILDCKH